MHYDPESFTEDQEAQWAVHVITGATVSPMEFKQASPRRWTMRVLFSDIGDDKNRRTTGAISVKESLNLLRRFLLPSDIVSTVPGQREPPTLVIYNLISQPFRCKLTRFTVVRNYINNATRETARAVVDLEFVEYIEATT